MLRSYLPILILLAIALIFVVASFAASVLLAPKRRTMAKTAPYECGIVPERNTQERFSVKFYLLAIAFIVLDVEIIFPFAYLLSSGVLNFGPLTSKRSKIVKPIIRSSGFTSQLKSEKEIN